jgi:hypothetical protein
MENAKGPFRFRRHGRRRLLAAAIGAALLVAAPGSVERGIECAQAAAFVEGTEDVPLMPGLAMVEGAGTVFDSPQGRIVEAYAKGKVARDAVLDFYGKTLPQLGWRPDGSGTFRREGETLRLEIYSEADGTTVRFYLAPG